MPHSLEMLYGLTANEILDGINRRFRAKVAVEGVVAEMQFDRLLRDLKAISTIVDFEPHDIDGLHDFSLQLPNRSDLVRVEVKNVRDADEGYREKGTIVAYKVEVQKTRAAKGDPTSRLYGVNQFDVLAVCLGKKTGTWSDFLFVPSRDLAHHPDHPHKLAVMHRVPLPNATTLIPWFNDLGALLRSL